jgi:hypothetical protein
MGRGWKDGPRQPQTEPPGRVIIYDSNAEFKSALESYSIRHLELILRLLRDIMEFILGALKSNLTCGRPHFNERLRVLGSGTWLKSKVKAHEQEHKHKHTPSLSEQTGLSEALCKRWDAVVSVVFLRAQLCVRANETVMHGEKTSRQRQALCAHLLKLALNLVSGVPQKV